MKFIPLVLWHLLLATLLLSCSHAQSSDSSSAEAAELAALAAALPICGLNCLETGLATSTCTDAACMCTNAPLQADITLCVAYNCTIPDSLIVKNVTNTACGVAIRDKSQYYNNISITLGVVSGFVILLRLGYKLFSGLGLAMDDWFILATILSGVPSSVIASLGTIPNGLGKDVWTLTPTQITNFVRFFYTMAALYFTQIALLKMSLLFFYLRIFPDKKIRRLLWGTIVFNTVWGIVFTLISIFECQPISYYWTNWDGEHTGTCLDQNAIGWANASISILEDIWMLAIPLSQLHSLHLHWKKKIGVGVMFFTGTFVTVISIIRLQALVNFANNSNPTWNQLQVSMWSTIEINIGIICACMPTLRLILLKFVPSLSSTRKATQYYANGPSAFPGKHSKLGDGSGASHMNIVTSKSHKSTAKGGGSGGKPDVGGSGSRAQGGIAYQRSYMVQFHDAADDETSSQIALRDLDHKGFEVSTHQSDYN